MSIQNYNIKKTSLRNDNTRPISSVKNPVIKQPGASDIANLSVPESHESTELAIPEKINESHLFVVDGQECICLTDTISPPQKTEEFNASLKL